MDPFTCNGVNATTGEYLLPDLTLEQIAKLARNEKLDPAELAELNARAQGRAVAFLGPKPGVDSRILAQAGWGVIFARSDALAEQKKAALAPLLNRRSGQAGARYYEYIGDAGLKPDDDKATFLGRYHMAQGAADPDKVPYYLLLVGDFDAIAYDFQYQMDIAYAVGRIHFEKLEEYTSYAKSVVAAEEKKTVRPRKATFFGVKNDFDKSTSLSHKHLVKPLADKLVHRPGWEIATKLDDDAMKADLLATLAAPDSPALLFTASHGVGFDKGDARQEKHQGALLCQNWPGPVKWVGKEIPAEHYFSADDTEGLDVGGLVLFAFACYGAGTPLYDDFRYKAGKQLVEIAERPFMARLPQKLLAQGALAVISHVGRAWGYSFVSPVAGPHLTVFESTLQQLMEGYPVGAAMEFFGNRYAEISADLTAEINKMVSTKTDEQWANMWISNNDAKSYVVIGDPAVTLATG